MAIHIIHGKHRREHRITRRQARQMFHILRAGYNARQAPGLMAPIGVVFVFYRTTVTRNDHWYHARPFSRADVRMKRNLHIGGASVLNIYIDGLDPRLRLLGYSPFPWQVASRGRQDGVTVSAEALPGGRARGYNRGDTVIHETGHWLGLFHTFQPPSPGLNGCDPPGDWMADTAAEREPNYTVPDPTNLCDPGELATPGVFDPALNFMDYTYDGVMRMFTPDQTAWMHEAYDRFRRGR